MKKEKEKKIIKKIIRILEKENCTVDEASSLCMAVQRTIECMTAVQFNKEKIRFFDW